jgi:hypothetical protein
MFCPECGVEYRPGFAHCTDCDVDLVPELSKPEAHVHPPKMTARHPDGNFPEQLQAKSLTKSIFTFVLHQFIGMYGIPFTAPLVFSLGFKILLLFGYSYSSRDFYSKTTEIPYFPVQVLFGLILGWLIGSSLQHKSMLWVWVLPLTVLTYSFLSLPMSVLEATSFLSRMSAKFSHFFGWGCRPVQHCLDQVLFTLPFYSSLGYSLGALLARAIRYRPSRKLALGLTCVGLIILFAIGIDLIFSARQTGWQNLYWMISATPVGLGVYLLYIAAIVRTRSSRNT